MSLCLIFLFFLCKTILGQNYSFVQNKMGSPFVITISALDTTSLSYVVNQSFSLVDSFNAIFSDYMADSELNKLNVSPANVWIPISKPLCDLIHQSQMAANKSSYAFDITIGQCTKIWRQARKKNNLPNNDSIEYHKKHIGSKAYTLNEKDCVIRKNNSVFSFDLGGIAKGYIAQKVSEFLTKNGFPRNLIDAGGDMVAGDAPIGKSYWRIGLEFPAQEGKIGKTIAIKNQAIATSGSTYQFIESNNQISSHIINPKTGRGMSHTNNVTVIAKNGADADWLATACSVLKISKAKNLIGRIKNTSLIIAENKAHLKLIEAGDKIIYINKK